MMRRRDFLTTASAAMTLAACGGGPAAFRAEMGIALYSLRRLMREDLPGALAVVRDLGFRKVEGGNLYGRSPEEFLALLKEAGLEATSMGAGYKDLDTRLDEVVVQARTLGAGYVVCSTIPHSAKHLTAEDAQSAAEHLNRWGERLAASGLRLCYHTHGTEFDPSPDGTQFDTLLKLTDPKFVNYEMDIFWIVYGFQGPVDFLRRYPGRFPLMHVKDMRHGLTLGLTPADVREDDSVPLGTGLVDVRAALLAAQETGVEHYFLEEEAVDALPQIRQSLQYIETLR